MLATRALAVRDAFEDGQPPAVLHAHCVDTAAAALALVSQVALAVLAERRRLPTGG